MKAYWGAARVFRLEARQLDNEDHLAYLGQANTEIKQAGEKIILNKPHTKEDFKQYFEGGEGGSVGCNLIVMFRSVQLKPTFPALQGTAFLQ